MNIFREEFERIRRIEIEAYETELKRKIECMCRKHERERVIGEQFAAIVKRYGADVSMLHAIHEREEKELESFVKEIRPPPAERQVPADFDQRTLTTYSAGFDRLKAGKAEFVGAYSLAPRKEAFEDGQGESGNPWLFPSTPQVIKIGMSDKGSGSGCWGGYIWYPAVHTSVFGFVPDKPGMVRVQPLIHAHGFYIIKSDDTCVSCKITKIYASVGMSVIQDGVASQSGSAVLVDEDDDNIYDQGTIDQWVWTSCDRLVEQKKPVMIKVNFYYGTLARGGGSYPEVNFKTGQNQILCPQVW